MPDEAGRASPTEGSLSWGGYPGGTTVERSEPLFPRRRAEPAALGQAI
jgi:hypothetical protein